MPITNSANHVAIVTDQWNLMPAPSIPTHFPEFANAIFDHATGKSLEYCHLIQIDK
jgi:hypothetical protein